MPRGWSCTGRRTCKGATCWRTSGTRRSARAFRFPRPRDSRAACSLSKLLLHHAP
jgi:hypothetical protein